MTATPGFVSTARKAYVEAMAKVLDSHAEPDPGEPLTAAEWAGMSDAERAFLQLGLDAADRGELVDEAAMDRHFDSLLATLAKR